MLNFLFRFNRIKIKFDKKIIRRNLYFTHKNDTRKDNEIEFTDLKNRKDEVESLTNNYTAPALASALYDREGLLKRCAILLEENRIEELRNNLHPYLIKSTTKSLNYIPTEIDQNYLDGIKKLLSRMPRQFNIAIPRRAAVVIPLCTSEDGSPSILFTVRSPALHHHKSEICFPGGMKDPEDKNIQETALRELKEEIGCDSKHIQVLGVLRSDWSQVNNEIGVGVTPIVGYIGDLRETKIQINPDEISTIFTQKLTDICDDKNWITREYSTPVYTHDGYIIWGFTGFLTYRLVQCILKSYYVAVAN